MRRAWLALGALVLVGIGLAIVRELAVQEPTGGPSFSSLMCRDVDAPYGAHPLARVAAERLSTSDELQASDLETPTVAQAKAVDELRSDGTPFVVCRFTGTSKVLLVRRVHTALDHCFGPADACPKPRLIWLTCFETLNLSNREHVEPRDCIGYPADYEG
jgi:hypothetical protein